MNAMEKITGLFAARYHLMHLLLLSMLSMVLFLNTPVSAQEEQPGPIYIVQEGDSLWTIAVKFGVELVDLQQINNLSSDQIAVGDRLVIPGFENIEGVIVTRSVPIGENIRSLSRQHRLSEENLRKLNGLISPAEMFAGSFLILPEQKETDTGLNKALLPQGQSLFEVSILKDVNPWKFVTANQLNSQWNAISGDVYIYETPSSQNTDPVTAGALPEEISGMEITPLSPGQGTTALISVNAPEELSLSGSFMGQPMNIFYYEDNTFTAIQGVHAMSDPIIYPLELTGTREDGSSFGFSQMFLISTVNYPYDRPLTVDPATIDPTVTGPEDAEWHQLASNVTSEKLWEGVFSIPSPLEQEYCLASGDCWSSRFGNRRSYNGSPYSSFHTGLDIVGRNGTEIYAPEAGIVVFTGPMTVRGNATMIDHGWGIYSAYMHQDEIFVQVGDRVEKGQLIGLVGATGRVEGPHLHWEIWAGGVQVDPLEWLTQAYP